MTVKFAEIDIKTTSELSELVNGFIAGMEEVTGKSFCKMSIMMDISATHATCPLDLDKLIHGPKGDTFHDLIGIMNHLDRKTGKLTDGFVPRCAA